MFFLPHLPFSAPIVATAAPSALRPAVHRRANSTPPPIIVDRTANRPPPPRLLDAPARPISSVRRRHLHLSAAAPSPARRRLRLDDPAWPYPGAPPPFPCAPPPPPPLCAGGSALTPPRRPLRAAASTLLDPPADLDADAASYVVPDVVMGRQAFFLFSFFYYNRIIDILIRI